MPLSFIGFKQTLFTVLKQNESDKAYQLSKADGDSGWSYGWLQFDLAKGPPIARNTFSDILRNAKDEQGNKIIPADQEETLFAAARKTDNVSLTVDQKTVINNALSSQYGVQEIDKATSKHLDYLIAFADTWIAKAPVGDKPFLSSDLGKVWLCDCRNQGFNPLTKYPKQFELFLQGQEYRGYSKQGDLSFDDILQVYFRQRQLSGLPPQDPFRRLANIVKVTGYSPATLEEAKEVLRAYTYYYVRNESALLESNGRVQAVNDFRNLICKPADDFMLSQWKPEWGPVPSLYDDILFGDDKNNNRNGGDYQLNGRDGNDIIFGEGGNDDIEGGKGNDILIGGIGDDTYYYRFGDGHDWIYDEDKQGKVIIVNSINGKEETIVLGNLYKKPGDTIWTDATGSIRFTHNSPWEAVLSDGGIIELGADFESGDLGIRLMDIPTIPVVTVFNWEDTTPGPDDDILHDSTGNDLIDGGAGDDNIYAHEGGNDWLLGGDGSDILNTQRTVGTNDVQEGGAGADLLSGGSGDDLLFGEFYGEMADLIAAGEIAPNETGKGDLISGSFGDDYIYGSNRGDALMGFAGNDLIVGGGGDDALFGDEDYGLTTRDWDFTITQGVGVSFINVIWDPGVYQGDDAIYAGTGNDFVYAGGGGDEVYGGEGNDTILGEAGDDFISGDAGDDFLEGDAMWVAVADQGNDYIDGGAGNDQIWGQGGSDDLFGGDGIDTIQGGEGDDYLDGEAGDDTYTATQATTRSSAVRV